uniref:Putative viral coat protein n=1 Tax=Little cherry virus 1 TaxID=217686 RepID=A0A346RRJ8_9CLOS|nr:putative viral coat protein [Little cherry virus 1]
MNFYDSYTITRVSFDKLEVEISLSSVETCIAVDKTYYVMIGDSNNNIRFELLSPDHISLNWRFRVELVVNGNLLNIEQSNEYIYNIADLDISNVDPRDFKYSVSGFNDVVTVQVNKIKLMNLKSTFITRNDIAYGVNEFYNKNLLRIMDEFVSTSAMIKSASYTIKIFLDGKPYLGSWYLNDGPSHKSIAYVRNMVESVNEVLDLIPSNYNFKNILNSNLTKRIDLDVNMKNNNCIRVYDVVKCSDESHQSVSLCELQTTNKETLNVILQYWIGIGNDILEFVLRCKNSYYGCEVWKNTNGKYSRLTDFEKYHSFTKYYSSGKIFVGFYYDESIFSYIFTINGTICCIVKNDLLDSNYEIGFEYQIFGKVTKNFNYKNFKRIESNNAIYRVLRYPYALKRPEVVDMTNHHINNNVETNSKILLTNINEVEDLFEEPQKRPTLESKNIDREMKKPRVESESVDDTTPIQPSVSNQTLNTNSIDIKQSSILTLFDNSPVEAVPNYTWAFEYASDCDQVISTIAKAIQISIGDAKLVVYQTAICCGTSVESVHDKHTSLIFNFVSNKRIYLRFIANCFFRKNTRINLFRRFMKSRTTEVLELLRIGKLSPSYGRAIKLNIPKQFAFLACDFWNFDEMNLTTQEHEVIGNLKSINKANQRIHLLKQ